MSSLATNVNTLGVLFVKLPKLFAWVQAIIAGENYKIATILNIFSTAELSSKETFIEILTMSTKIKAKWFSSQ